MTEGASTPTALWAPWALPIASPPMRNALIELRDGRITAVTASVPRERATEIPGCTICDDCIIAPGFVNAHSHIEYAAYGALSDGLSFTAWITDHIRRKRRLGPDHMLASAQLGAWQSIAGGITATGDASYSGDALQAMLDVGMRGRVYLEVFGLSEEEAAWASVLGRAQQLEQVAGSGSMVAVGISPHAPYTVSRRLYGLVARSGLPTMTHLLESEDELECTIHGRGELAEALTHTVGRAPAWGESPLRALLHDESLHANSVAVHCVHIAPDEIEGLAARSISVAHCPRSNARLGCGVLDLTALDRAGVVVALGTDSPASAGPIDMFAEMRCAIEMHRSAGRDPVWPSAARVLRMATLDAAAALDLEGAGQLAPGAHADIVVAQTGPVADPTIAYVLGCTPADVELVLVAGRERWRRDRTRGLQVARERARDTRTLLAVPAPAGAPQHAG